MADSIAVHTFITSASEAAFWLERKRPRLLSAPLARRGKRDGCAPVCSANRTGLSSLTTSKSSVSNQTETVADRTDWSASVLACFRRLSHDGATGTVALQSVPRIALASVP